MRTTDFIKRWVDKLYNGSTKEAAEATGFAQRTIQAWLSGDRVPPAGTLRLLKQDYQLKRMTRSTTACDDQFLGEDP